MSAPDQAQRDAARFELARNVVVEAGAGTGKTTLLTDRLLFLLVAGGPAGQGLDLARVVALTFTEKAAGEIQLRLAGRLADLLAETEGRLADGPRRSEARRFLEEASRRFGRDAAGVAGAARAALERMDRAMIGTIHHFASHLLRLHPLEAGVDPSFEVDDGAAFEELFESEWALWLDGELGEHAFRRDAWLETLPLAGLADLEALARALCREETRSFEPGPSPAMRSRLRELAAWLRSLPSTKPPPGGRSKILERAEEAARRLEEAAEAAEGGGRLPERLSRAPLAKAAWPKAWEDDPDQERFEEALALARLVSADAERLVRRAVELLAPFARRFAEAYRRRGLISYFGLLRQARDLVRDHAGVREELKSRYGALLIDEFQDTDPVQGELLLYLAERPGGSAADWRRVELEPGKLFVVGDPKQSIYRFRGADIRAYEDFTAALERQGALRCSLQASFRSHPGVVGAANAVHGRLMRPVAGLQPRYLPIQPVAPLDPVFPGLEAVVVREPEGRKATADDVRRAEAAWIARWIAERCGPGKALEYKHVALLLRTTTALGPYLDALKESGLPYAVEADRYFYGTQEVLDLLNLLRALDDPSDRRSLAGLLRSPLALLDDKDLHALAQAGALDYRRDPPPALPGAARERLGGLWRALRGLRARAGREPLGDFVARVFRETFLVELCAAAYYGEQTASNLLKFARLAAEAGDVRGATLKEFIGLVERAVDEGADEGESPLADEHLDAVRVLTIHKAKGLEWPVVFLPNLAARPHGGEGPAWRVDWSSGAVGLSLPGARASDVAMAFLRRDEAVRQRHEAVRLLYVAMTRSRRHTILLGGERAGAGSLAALLREAGAFPEAGISAERLALDGRDAAVTYLDRPLERPESRLAGGSVSPADPSAAVRRWTERAALAAQARAPLSTSATALAADEAPWRPDARRREDEDLRLADPTLVGVVCHRVLEAWDFRSGGEPAAAVASACAALRRETAADWDAIESESRALLAGFLASPAASELAGAEILGRELPFVYADGGGVVRGAIDVLYRRGGRLWLGDYKSGPAPKPGEIPESYRTQARVYLEAAARALGEPCGFKLFFLRSGGAVEVPLERPSRRPKAAGR